MNGKKAGIIIGIVAVVSIATIVAVVTMLFLSKDEQSSFYKITFINEEIIETVYVKENELVIQPINPTKEEYTFEGWYYNGAKFNFTTKITKDINLEARWTLTSAKKWVIKFDCVGGEPIDYLNVVDGEKIEEIPTPIKEGYKFLGWYVEEEEFDFNTIIKENITLTAKWEKDGTQITTYTITFDTKGGSKVNSQIVEANKVVSKPSNPTKEGYVFIGWYNGKVEFDFKTKITQNIKLTAQWKEIENPNEPEKLKKYTITFDTKGGSTVPNQTVEEGKTINKPTDPTKSGYKFIGWYYNDTLYNFSNVVKSNVLLVAKWEEIKEVTYSIEPIADSYVGQVKIFVLQGNDKVDGTVDITTTNGKKITKNIPKEGYITNGAIIEKIENAKVK